MDRFINIEPNILEVKLEGAKDSINVVIEIRLFMLIIIIFLIDIKDGEQVLIVKIYNFKIDLGIWVWYKT